MKLLKCKNHEVNNCYGGEYVPKEVPEITCSTCLIKATIKIDAEKEAKIEALKTTPTNTPVHKRKRWTPAEEEIILKNAKECDIPELMSMLPGRTAYAVEARIWHLKMEHVAKQKYVDA
tara:strand:+ start:6549 stop:6905 length:357 start_codon:yes stop_codon:yes gene_type:complete